MPHRFGQYEVNLIGKGHFEKTLQRRVATPHVSYRGRTGNYRMNGWRAAGPIWQARWSDLARVYRYLAR